MLTYMLKQAKASVHHRNAYSEPAPSCAQSHGVKSVAKVAQARDDIARA